MKLKRATPPVLAFPDFDRPFVVESYASFLSLGASLAQKKKDGRVLPVQLASRTIGSSQKKYATCEREALAIIFALKKLKVYLLSSIPFTAITDREALRHTFPKKDVNGRLARWSDVLAS